MAKIGRPMKKLTMECRSPGVRSGRAGEHGEATRRQSVVA